MLSPYHCFWGWCFDGYKNTPIPTPNENTPDILKYNSPIHETFLLKSFVRCGKLNHYLNTQLNNINLRYIAKEDLFHFIKKCIQDFKIKRNDIHFSKYGGYKEALFKKVRSKYPVFKNSDIDLMCELINKDESKDAILGALGIEKPKKVKLKEKKKLKKISSKNFLISHFNIMEVGK